MSIFRFAAGRRTKWLILAGWTAIALFVGPKALDFDQSQDNRDRNYLPSGAESSEAIAMEERAFGDQLLTGLLVYNNPAGLTRADKAAVAGAAEQLAKRPLMGQLGEPLPLFFEDGKTAALYTQIKAEGDQEVLFAASDRLRELAAAAPPGTTVKLSGQTGFYDDTVRVFDSIDGNLLLGTIALITLLLLLIYRSPFLWILPLATVGIAEVTSRGLGTELAERGMTITTQSAALMTVLVFGVGTDYALLLIARYREELRHYTDRHEAMAHALDRSGPPILASAATVIAALLCLTLADVNATAGAGPIGAMGIAVAMLAMLTALPALLLVFGRPVFWPFVPRVEATAAEIPVNFWSRLADRIAARPALVTFCVVLLMGVMSLGLMNPPGGLDLTKSFRDDVESVQGMEILAKALPPGATGPAVVMVEGEDNVPKAVAALKKSPDVAAVGIVQPGNGATRIEATLKYEPYSDAAIDAVPRLRAALDAAAPGAALLAGASAIESDSREFAAQDNRLIMPLVLLVVLLVLILLLRSIVAPLVLMATVVASFVAVLGASYLAFEHIFGFPGVDEYVPLFVFIFLVALGVDYNIFLMARVREEAQQYGAREGMRRGLVVTGGVITSAGIVLAGTFLVLAAMPITALTEIGFAIAMGVLFDALIVRTALVPALGFMLGRHMWWPAKIGDSPVAVAAPGQLTAVPDLPGGPGEHPDSPHDTPPAPQTPLPDWRRISGSGRYG